MKQGLAFHDILDREGDPNQGRDHDEAQLLGGEERRLVNQTNVELGLGLDEIGHRLRESPWFIYSDDSRTSVERCGKCEGQH